MISVKFFDIVKKFIGYDNRNEIFTNGEDNAYPEKIDRLINNSVTAKMASGLMTQYFIGRGFGSADDIVINDNEQTTIKVFAQGLAQELVNDRGVFIHVNYEINDSGVIVPVNPRVLPFDWCRIGKKDGRGYNGTIHVKTDWRDSKEQAQIYNVYNDNEKVLAAQIKKDKGIENYKGQVFYYNPDVKYHYPLARIDTVMSDCDSEAQASIYKNQLLRKGFFGKTLIVLPSLVDSNIYETVENEAGETVPNREYTDALSEADEITNNIEQFIGVEGAGGCMVMTLDTVDKKLEDAILIKNIEANIDADMFEGVESSVRENILMSFNNLPIGLVKGNEGLFSDSGGAILEMKKTYWENTTTERDTFLMILNKFTKSVLPNIKLKSISLIDKVVITAETPG